MRVIDLNSDEIATLTMSREFQTLEFKERTGMRRKATRTLCASLNRRGGQVLFGVTRAGEK